MPQLDDRSTALARIDIAVTPAVMGRHARRFVLASVTLLVAACSSLQLGYNNADTLLAYSLDRYLDLDNRQEQLAHEGITALHRWHRSTQLADYARLIDEARGRVGGTVSAADVRDFYARINLRLVAVGEQAAPDLARLALTLQPSQIEHLSAKLARDASKARTEVVRFAGTQANDRRIDRYTERAERFFGDLTPAQHELIRVAVARRPDAQDAWLQERERRGRDLVALLARIRAERPATEAAAAWIRGYVADLAQPRDAQRRARLEQMRQDTAELVAELINSATPAQRAFLADKLRGYASDLNALSAPGDGARG